MVVLLERGYCQLIDTDPRPEMLYNFVNGEVLRKCLLSNDRLEYYKDEYNAEEIKTTLLTPYCKKCRFSDGEWHKED